MPSRLGTDARSPSGALEARNRDSYHQDAETCVSRMVEQTVEISTRLRRARTSASTDVDGDCGLCNTTGGSIRHDGGKRVKFGLEKD